MNYKDEILRVANGEKIIGLVMQNFDGYEQRHNDRPDLAKYSNKVLTWDEAAPLLDYWPLTKHNGSASLQPIVAWTENWVLFTVIYEDQAWISKVERNPIECVPVFYGGQ